MSSNQNTPINESNSDNSRWWEFYFVRYLIGSIIGTLIISYVAFKNPTLHSLFFSGSKNGWIALLKESYWMFLIIGFGYCYISSAPILVAHACRFTMKPKIPPSGKSNGYQIGFIVAIILTFIFCLISLIDKLLYFQIMSKILLVVIIIIQTTLIYKALANDQLLKFYKSLTKSRMLEKTSTKRHDYVNSYKHLREHGNAFLILLMELLLGFILINTNSMNEIIGILTLWVFPSGFVWLIGTYLEFNLKKLN